MSFWKREDENYDEDDFNDSGEVEDPMGGEEEGVEFEDGLDIDPSVTE